MTGDNTEDSCCGKEWNWTPLQRRTIHTVHYERPADARGRCVAADWPERPPRPRLSHGEHDTVQSSSRSSPSASHHTPYTPRLSTTDQFPSPTGLDKSDTAGCQSGKHGPRRSELRGQQVRRSSDDWQRPANKHRKRPLAVMSTK